MKIEELLASTALTELKMSPTNLKAMAAQVPGALVGMEFEMYVPNVEGDDDSDEWDLDMDMDGYIEDSSWRAFKNDLATFYSSGDFSEGTKRWYESRIDDQIGGDYFEWASDKFYEWARDGAFEEWYKEEYPDEELPKEDSPGWDNAMERFRDEKWDEFSEDVGSLTKWLEEERIDRYYTIGDRYGWSWPHLTNSSSGGGTESIQNVADDFESAVGIDVDVSSQYHAGRKSTTKYTIEPDSSLDSPESSDDRGLEFVSPPLSIDQMIDQLKKVKAWAGIYGCYTNKSCGLHINVSIPNFDINKLDYVKLALLVGDDYVANQFGRLGVNWARSSLEQIKSRIKSDPDKIAGYLHALKNGLNTIASKLIHSGQTDKYVTLNTKDNRVEFRAPGGDWLDTDLDKLINTMLRFVVALDVAMDSEKEKREYAKKFYKLLSDADVIQDQDTLKYFAQYSSGQLPKTALKSFVRNIQQQRTGKKATEGQNNYQIIFYGADGNEQKINIPASSRREAVEKFRKDWPETEYSIKEITGDQYS